MTAAHELLSKLELSLEKGEHTRYPASTLGPIPGYRFWATQIEDCIQFGPRMSLTVRLISPFFLTLGILASSFVQINERHSYVFQVTFSTPKN